MWWPSVPAAVTAPQTITCCRSFPGPASVGPNWSKGQIFIAVMPLARRSAASSPARPFMPGVEIGIFPVADAGVVDRDPVAAAAAEHGVDRQPGDLAEQVPERHVDRRDRPHLGPHRAAEIHQREHVAPVILDVARVAADQQRREDVMDDRGDGARQVIGLAEAGQAGIGVNADPQVVGQRLPRRGVQLRPLRLRQRLEPDGLDLGDLHARSLGVAFTRSADGRRTGPYPFRTGGLPKGPPRGSLRASKTVPPSMSPEAIARVMAGCVVFCLLFTI